MADGEVEFRLVPPELSGTRGKLNAALYVLQQYGNDDDLVDAAEALAKVAAKAMRRKAP